jgi:phosphoribosyl 1,2-cyclic phosphate phosphodiesterase
MEITFLGTAAATSYPLAFCKCGYCTMARKRAGKDLRKRSSIIINNDLMIDFGPDSIVSTFMHNKDLSEVRYLLQTHPHPDHFDASHLATRIPEYLGVNTPPLEVFASHGTFKKMTEMLINDGYVKDIFDEEEQKRMNLRIQVVKHNETYIAGNYQITAFATDHDISVESMIYSITQNNITALYATDTDKFIEETWTAFKDKDIKFDIVIMDHTYGPDADSGDHLNANRFIEQIKRMKSEDLLSDSCRILATHLSHEGNPTHDELSEFAKSYGYEIACDGLIVKL